MYYFTFNKLTFLFMQRKYKVHVLHKIMKWHFCYVSTTTKQNKPIVHSAFNRYAVCFLNMFMYTLTSSTLVDKILTINYTCHNKWTTYNAHVFWKFFETFSIELKNMLYMHFIK